MKKIYFSFMAMALVVCFTACRSEKEELTSVPVFDASKILGSWTVNSYSYVMTNTDVDTLMVSDVRQNAGEITVQQDQEQYTYTETFTDPNWGEHSGDIVLHETTFDLRGSALDYPQLDGLSVNTNGNAIVWESSFTGHAEQIREQTGQPDQVINYNYKIEISISVTKK